MTLGALYLWIYVIMALVGAAFVVTQIGYARARRAYDRELARTVLAAERANSEDPEAPLATHAGVVVGEATEQVRESSASANPQTGTSSSPTWTAPHWVLTRGLPATPVAAGIGLGAGAAAFTGGSVLAAFKAFETNEIGQLTERELECLRLVDKHMSSRDIARELGLSKHTVDWHLDKARRRLSTASRYEAARLVFGSQHASQPSGSANAASSDLPDTTAEEDVSQAKPDRDVGEDSAGRNSSPGDGHLKN